MTTLQLPVSQWFDTKMEMNTTTLMLMLVYNNNSKITCIINHADMVFLFMVNITIGQVKKCGYVESITCKTNVYVEHQYFNIYCTTDHFPPV